MRVTLETCFVCGESFAKGSNFESHLDACLDNYGGGGEAAAAMPADAAAAAPAAALPPLADEPVVALRTVGLQRILPWPYPATDAHPLLPVAPPAAVASPKPKRAATA